MKRTCFQSTGQFLVLVVAVGIVLVGEAAELGVPDQYANIQAAINSASDGDVIVLADGTPSRAERQIVATTTAHTDPQLLNITLILRWSPTVSPAAHFVMLA